MASKAMKRIIDAAGGPAKLAKYFKISRSAVSQWERVPVDRVLGIEELSGISRHELRPDIYPEPVMEKVA